VCGIAGIFHYDGRPVDPSLLASLSVLLRERGPDDEGSYADAGIGLVHRRLSIIDLSAAGRCPMANEDGSLQIVFNGEVYNYQELRPSLEASQHRFRSRSDTEVVLHAIEEWGDAALTRLEGMFALALWDGKRRRLLLARDRLGEKPLYYGATHDTVAFSSSIQAVHLALGGRLPVDPDGIAAHLCDGFIPGPGTIWTGISQLPPAHLLWATPEGAGRPVRYWSLPAEAPRRVGVREAESRVMTCIERSVRQRLIADVPVGGFLSGGVDSSLVMAVAARQRAAIHTFSIAYEGQGAGELPFARQVAQTLGSTHHELNLTSADMLGVLPSLVWHFGQPFGDSSCIPTHWVSRLARSTVKVCLSGDGGDESFGGYRRAAVARRADLWRSVVPDLVRFRVIPSVAGTVRGTGRLAKPLRRLSRLNDVSTAGGAYRQNALSWREQIGPIGGEALIGRPGIVDAARPNPQEEGASLLRQALFDDLTCQLPYDFLTKVDVASMAASLEVRAPLLDHRLVEEAWRLPDHLKVRLGGGKWLLKRLAARMVPKEAIYRPKVGFAIPARAWWSGPLQPVLRVLMEDSRAVRQGWIRAAPVLESLEEHRQGKRFHETRLWLILTLELWARIVVDRSLSPDAMLQETCASTRGA
jgi:asparagine synthase (glutamine-hydrolysing)